MRTAIGIAVLTAFILSFSGCASTENPHTTGISSQETVVSEARESTEPEESRPLLFRRAKKVPNQPPPRQEAKRNRRKFQRPLKRKKRKSNKYRLPKKADRHRPNRRKRFSQNPQRHQQSLRKNRQRLSHRRKAPRRLRKNQQYPHLTFRLGLILPPSMLQAKVWD